MKTVCSFCVSNNQQEYPQIINSSRLSVFYTMINDGFVCLKNFPKYTDALLFFNCLIFHSFLCNWPYFTDASSFHQRERNIPAVFFNQLALQAYSKIGHAFSSVVQPFAFTDMSARLSMSVRF
jgi:hypothetical protein